MTPPVIFRATLFTLAYVFLLGTFSDLDVWQSRFFEPGRIYRVYNLLRVLFLVYLFLMCPTVGRWVLRIGKSAPLGPFDRFLVASYVGAAVLIIVGFVLGLCQLYYKFVALALTTPIVFASYPLLEASVRTGTASLGEFSRRFNLRYFGIRPLFVASLFVLLAGLLGFRLLAFGLDVDLDLTTRDVPDHYMPNYLEVIHQKGLWPNHYFHQYHYTKGAGLHFLSVLLTDVHSFQLASYYLNVLSVLALYRLVHLGHGAGHLWPLLASVLFLTCPPTLAANYQKLHWSMAALLVFPFYVLVLWVKRAYPAGQALVPVALVSVATLVLVSAGIVLVLPLLAFFLVLLRLYRGGISTPAMGLVLMAPICAYAFILVCNYVVAGAFEITPATMGKYSNPLTVSQWFSPTLWSTYWPSRGEAVDWKNVVTTLSTRGVSGSIWEPGMLPQAVLSYLIGAALVWLVLRRRSEDPVFGMIGLVSAAAIALGLCIELTNSQDSTARFLVFRYYFKILLYVWTLMAVCRLAAGKRWQPALVVALTAVTIWYGHAGAYPAMAELATQCKETIRFVRGRSSYAQLYERAYSLQSARNIRSLIGPTPRVWAIDQQHCLLSNLPHRQFCYMLPDFGADTDRVLAGLPKVARDVLENKYRLRYFLASVAPQPGNRSGPAGGIGPLGHSPLFAERSLVENFRVFAQVDESEYLLTWRPAADSGKANGQDMEPFLSRWRARANTEDESKWIFANYRLYAHLGAMRVAARMWDQSPAVPKVALFTSWRQGSTRETAAECFLTPGFDPRQELVLEKDPGFPGTSRTLCAEIISTEQSRGRMEAEVETATNGIVLFQEDWHRFWEARVDGQAAPVLRANGKYLAVAVPEGRHQITFHYHDRYLLRAFRICAGLVMVVLLLVVWALWPGWSRAPNGSVAAGFSLRESHTPTVVPAG